MKWLHDNENLSQYWIIKIAHRINSVESLNNNQEINVFENITAFKINLHYSDFSSERCKSFLNP